MTFAAMITMLSQTYGRHQRRRAVGGGIHAPQATVENASVSPMTGEAARSSSDGLVPAQNSMKNRIATKTMALPRSGCLSTSRHGIPAMSPGMIRSRSVAGASRMAASWRASIRITASFASSAGWPKRWPPIASQDLLPAAGPAPGPIHRGSMSRNSAMPYTNGVAHSSMRGDVRNVSTATIRLRPSHTNWRCQIVSTNVGTSVWPAEYSVARPYSASATTAMARGLSSSRARDSTVWDDRTCGIRTGGIGTRESWTHRIRDQRNLERGRCGIVGNGHLHGGCGALVNAEVVRDSARHQRSDRSPVPGELDNRADHDLRLIGGGAGHESATLQSVRALWRRPPARHC